LTNGQQIDHIDGGTAARQFFGSESGSGAVTSSDAELKLPAITLDQLIALNDEIAALVRAGIPLESGLGQLGGDLPGRFGRLAAGLARRMEQGEALGVVLAREVSGFPPVYRAVVEAGMRTGRLAAALESVAGAARRLAETRRLVLSSFLYPLLVFLFAWCMFLVLVTQIAPRIAVPYAAFSPRVARPLEILASWSPTVAYWGPAVPAVVVLLAVLWWVLSGRGSLVESAMSRVLLGWIPWIGPMLHGFRAAALAEFLAMLVESDVPLGESLRLAGQAAGDARLRRGADRLAEAVLQGRPLDARAARQDGLPPMLVWLMMVGQRRSGLAAALRQAADHYHRHAYRQAEAARLFLPMLLTVLVGGGATLAFALAVFVPWITLLQSLS